MAKGGKRLGAGRKAHLEDKTVEEILNLAASTVYKALQPGSELPYETKVELAARILIKRIPQKIEAEKGLIQMLNVYLPSDPHIHESHKPKLPNLETT